MIIFYHCTFYSIEFLIRPKFLVLISWKSLFFLVHILTYRHILTIPTYYPTSSDKKRGFHFYAPDTWPYAACLVACPCSILGCDIQPLDRSAIDVCHAQANLLTARMQTSIHIIPVPNRHFLTKKRKSNSCHNVKGF